MQIALVVVANPYKALDHEGRPACAVNYPGSSSIVGGVFDHEAHKASQETSVAGEGKHIFSFSEEPVRVVCDSIAVFGYFRNRVIEGALLPADEFTARKCGIAIDAKNPFVPADKALADAKKAAADEFKAATGLDAPFTVKKTTKAAPAANKEA